MILRQPARIGASIVSTKSRVAYNQDQFIGSWFWNNTLDVLVLATEYLVDRRIDMPSFRLKRVAKTVGLYVDEGRLHDALYDIELTRSVYRIVTGRDIEI